MDRLRDVFEFQNNHTGYAQELQRLLDDVEKTICTSGKFLEHFQYGKR